LRQAESENFQRTCRFPGVSTGERGIESSPFKKIIWAYESWKELERAILLKIIGPMQWSMVAVKAKYNTVPGCSLLDSIVSGGWVPASGTATVCVYF
jgi:hypothetical protein